MTLVFYVVRGDALGIEKSYRLNMYNYSALKVSGNNVEIVAHGPQDERLAHQLMKIIAKQQPKLKDYALIHTPPVDSLNKNGVRVRFSRMQKEEAEDFEKNLASRLERI